MKTSLTRKFIMSLSGFFLITFILVHLLINLFSLGLGWDGRELFNAGSHFMASNPLIQVMQYVLALGFIIHISMGIKLTLQNNKARPIKYAKNNAAASSSLSSRSMIFSGVLVLVFLLLHMKDFLWEIKFNHLSNVAVTKPTDFDLLLQVFHNPLYVVVYVLAFIGLGIHLNHGFQSAFQSVGANHGKYTPMIKKGGLIYSIFIAIGFSSIAIYHFITQL